ncbi:MAG TPA: TIGR00282 family metallophosphoesterase [Candidatus Cloacimonadota bacterium]|nr:TIGR00282 family metallophosphoesterase [Candidatus Cloacimonadota bacterium]HPT71322.1 TIGR00282 family metallophosphoesterase [Candidatus Cloacimonadota bacterium]
MRILFLGDIFGKPGRTIAQDYVPYYRKEYGIDLCIANCENIADGRGVTERTAKELFSCDIDILTSGNHLWDRQESHDYLRAEKRIVRPANYPPGAIGNQFVIAQCENGETIAIVSLVGQAFMTTALSPYFIMEELLPVLHEHTKSIFVDFHAESTAEKRAFGMNFDGRISAMIGTHTHIQTADEEILPNGTAYLTDAGMTGPHDSVIGIRKEIIIEKMITGMPLRYEVADTGNQINGVIVEIDAETGLATHIQRLRENV